MHLSDFTYLERCSLYVYTMAFLIYSIWQGDRFRCLHPKRIFSGELKSVCTVLMILMFTVQVLWDLIFVRIKYTEGYVMYHGVGIGTPYQYWSSRDQQLASTATYIQAAAFSIQTCLYFMLQCFWAYLSNTLAKKSFMGSPEFMFYMFWAIATMALFPVLQWYYHDDPIRTEAVPQIPYAIEILFIGLLGIRTNFRFKRLIAQAITSNLSTGTINKLAYFKDINQLMAFCLISYSLGFLIMCIDGLTEAKTIAMNKFATDCILANINFMALALYILLIWVFHPLQTFMGAPMTQGGTSSYAKPSTYDPSAIIRPASPITSSRQPIQHAPAASSTFVGSMPSSSVAAHGEKELVQEHNNGFTRADPSTRKPSKGKQLKRLSQRITSFIEERSGASSARFHHESIMDPYQSNHLSPMPQRGYVYEGKTFMAPMNPISADMPTHIDDHTPTSNMSRADTAMSDTRPLVNGPASPVHYNNNDSIDTMDNYHHHYYPSHPSSDQHRNHTSSPHAWRPSYDGNPLEDDNPETSKWLRSSPSRRMQQSRIQ
ncbi:hypothetical protein BC940DRAFT_295820 [Gongronella butleri]|nr:hypothetical protein BC940DRAFT_295820 [Gongronella butleri]